VPDADLAPSPSRLCHDSAPGIWGSAPRLGGGAESVTRIGRRISAAASPSVRSRLHFPCPKCPVSVRNEKATSREPAGDREDDLAATQTIRVDHRRRHRRLRAHSVLRPLPHLIARVGRRRLCPCPPDWVVMALPADPRIFNGISVLRAVQSRNDHRATATPTPNRRALWCAPVGQKDARGRNHSRLDQRIRQRIAIR
jgi:hypothetical protein